MSRIEKNMTRISKAMAKFLRHAPEELGIKLDENGWTNLTTFVEKMKLKGFTVNENMLRQIVKQDSKGRYSISQTMDTASGKPVALIRANQGHSTKEVDLEFKKASPPAKLYHGTTTERWGKICNSGALIPMSRQYVHLTADLELARKGATRWRGEKPLILAIEAETMVKDGFEFNVSDNDVWLVKSVPVKYIEAWTDGLWNVNVNLLIKNV